MQLLASIFVKLKVWFQWIIDKAILMKNEKAFNAYFGLFIFFFY